MIDNTAQAFSAGILLGSLIGFLVTMAFYYIRKPQIMSKEQTPMNSDRIKEIQIETGLPNSVSVQQALLKVWNECEQYHKQQTNVKVLEALGEVDKYCDGKISHFSKSPMDLQGIHATREVKTYLNILRNRSKTKV